RMHSMSDTPSAPEHDLDSPPIGGPMLPLAGDVYELDAVDGPDNFPPWCARYRNILREFRVHLGQPGAGVAPIEFDIVREIILQCRQNLAGFGFDTPAEYGFGDLTTAEAETFRVWCISAPRAAVIRLIERVEDYLSWAAGQVLRQVEQKHDAPASREPPKDPPPPCQENALELIPGGFTYRGKVQDLTGKPRAMLEALLASDFRRCSADDLRQPLGLDDDAVTYPEQV